MDSQQRNSRDDAPNGELGVDAQQLGQIQAAGAGDQQGDAGSGGDQHSEQQEEADGEDQAAGESQAGQESSGAAAAQGPFSLDLRERVKDLGKLVRDIMAEKQTKPGGSHFQGVKLRPADPPKFSGANKEVVKDWLATVFQWLGSGNCVPTQRVPLAQTFLTGGAATLWRAKSAVLQSQGFDIWIGMSLPGLWRQPLGIRIQSRMQGTSWMSLSRLIQWRTMLTSFNLSWLRL